MTKMDGKTPDIAQENIEALRQLFPDVFSEEKIDFAKLRQVLGDYVDDATERYNFTWNGKGRALRLAQSPSTGTLRPCKEVSKNWDDTQNLYIEGDNLEVLKLLQKSYHGKVKMIYIDPPYNTGGDFVYPDDYADNLENYKRITGQVDENGRPISANTESDGRYHSKWLNMMYPRLRLARSLLQKDGAIFISIDDTEQENLKKLCNEIYGEDNHVVTLVWDKNRKNDAKYFSVGHEYMHVYFKDKGFIDKSGIVFRTPKEGIEEVKAEFERLRLIHDNDWNIIRTELKRLYDTWEEDDPRKPLARFSKVDDKGPYRDDGNINWPGGGGPMYDVIHPITGQKCKKPVSGWRYPTLERLQEEVERGHVVFGPDETTVPRVRMNLFDSEKAVMRSVQFSYAQTATNEFNNLFNGKRVFENPKHFGDIQALLAYLPNNEDSITLDFFSGSGTTAHAVMKLNSEDGGNRKYIMVQLPEPCNEKGEAYKAGYSNICEIGKERIRRAGEKIKAEIEEHNAQLKLDEEPKQVPDIGFKVFKLDSSNLKKWDTTAVTLDENGEPQFSPEQLELDLQGAVSNYVSGRTELDVVYEILLKLGLDLTYPVEQHTIAGKNVFTIGFGALMICLDDAISTEVAQGMIDLKTQLSPETWRVVFKDNGFASDSEKVNICETFKLAGLDEKDFTTV